MPDLDFSKMKDGREAKKEILKGYKTESIYEKLQMVSSILMQKTGVSLFGFGKPSPERQKVNATITSALERLQKYYGSKEDVGGIKTFDAKNAAAKEIATDMIELQNIFTEDMKNAVAEYKREVLKNDKDVVKKFNGDYKNAPVNKDYIYRHVALDLLEEVCEMGKHINDNYISNVNKVVADQTTGFTMEDVVLGSDVTHKDLIGSLPLTPDQPDQQLDVNLDILKKFAVRGNSAATKVYNELKGLDLKEFYTSANGQGFPVLDAEKLDKLSRMAEKIEKATADYQGKMGPEALSPELRKLDTKYPDYADEYAFALRRTFDQLKMLSGKIKEGVENAKKHPELMTAPAILRGHDDTFLDTNSICAKADKLSDVIEKGRGKSPNFTAAMDAFNVIKDSMTTARETTDSLYAVAEDGTFVPVHISVMNSLQKEYEKIEKAIAQNEKTILDNLGPAFKKEAEAALNAFKNTLKNNKEAIANATKDAGKYEVGSPENGSYSLAQALDPNPAVREQMKQVREERINASYAEAYRKIELSLKDPSKNAAEIMQMRVNAIDRSRFFALDENREKYKGLLSSLSKVQNTFINKFKKDYYGGYKEFSTDDDRIKLITDMKAAQKEIQEALKKGKNIPEYLKENMGATSDLLQTHIGVLEKANIAGKFNMAELLDAGKFGFPPIEQAYKNANGYDRFDWTNTNRTSDYEEPDYAAYKKPIDKIKEDLGRFEGLADGSTQYTDAQRKFMEDVKGILYSKFDKLQKYYNYEMKEDSRFQVGDQKMLVEEYPLLTKADQDELLHSFQDLQKTIQDYANTDDFKKSNNQAFKSFISGMATLSNTTVHRLGAFRADLNISLFTIQEAMSGRADTSRYNFRNELERFTRLHKSPDLAYKLTKAGVLMKEEDKWEINKDGQRVRKVVNNASIWSRVVTAVVTGGRRAAKDLEFVKDYNDLTRYLEMMKEFEDKYFRTLEDGSYPDLPRTGERVLDGDFKGGINSVERLQYVYEQIQYLSIMLSDKCKKYNDGKKPEDQIPQEYINGLDNLHHKGLICQTLVCNKEADYTKPDCINIMEMMHSDPEKAKNIWTIRQNKIFHDSYLQEGQTGSYRNLAHFQYEYNSNETYNGRFFDIPKVPSKEGLSEELDKLKPLLDGASEQAKQIAEELIAQAKADPDAFSKVMPTIGDINANIKKNKVLDGSILEKAAAENEKLGGYEWWNNEKDREMIQSVLSGISGLGINHADAKAREEGNVSYGYDLTMNMLALSRMSEKLGVDKKSAKQDARLVSKAYIANISVPGEDKTYRGLMVETVPEKILYNDPYKKSLNDNIEVLGQSEAKVITGKEILLNGESKNLTMQQFNNPKMIKDLANLQAICYLCGAPLPKFEDMKFAQIPSDDKGHYEARLIHFEPKPMFQEGEFAGKIKLEDLGVLSGELGSTIKNLYSADEKETKRRISDFVRDIVSGYGTKEASKETMDQMTRVVTQNVTEMCLALNNKKLTSEGALLGNSKADLKVHNGIKHGKLLITDDFKSLTVDKLSFRNGIFSDDANAKGHNIFTDISKIPERAYYLKSKMQGGGGLTKADKEARCRDCFMREISRMNLEAVIKDLEDKHDEYAFHKDSKEYKQMLTAIKALYKFEKTGVLDYTKGTGGKIEIGFPEGTDKEQLGNFKDTFDEFYRELQNKVHTYVSERQPGIFGKIHDMGKRRLDTATALENMLGPVSETLDNAVKTDVSLVADALDGVKLEDEKRKKVDIVKDDQKERDAKRSRRNSVKDVKQLQKQEDVKHGENDQMENNKAVVPGKGPKH
ncbi:MAG: hypothetical protein IJ600_05570 [Lachnospiraceae bacterium]|nr:hypothetical protein [Lachnospiraceae bacterium]